MTLGEEKTKKRRKQRRSSVNRKGLDEEQKKVQSEVLGKLPTMTLEELSVVNLDGLTLANRLKVQTLIVELRKRKTDYPILDYKPLPHQQDVINAVAKRRDNSFLPVYKFIMFIGGNGSGKTMGGIYIDILMALGEDTKKYGLPYIGSAKQILIVTKTSDVIKTNLEPYLLGGGAEDIIKFPPNEVLKIKRDPSSGSLKEVVLKNGCKILFRTYDAGQARLEGSSPDFIHLDELPEREDIFIELLRGTRKAQAQMMLTFTPTKFNPAVFNFFYGQENNGVKDRTYIREVDSLENIHVDHTWLGGVSKEELEIRRFGKFIPPTGLVYNAFRRGQHVMEFVHPQELGQIKVYGALDFGVSHPMAFLFIAVDEDGHIYVFDMIYEKNLLLSELVKRVRNKSQEYGITFEYIVADTADKRSRIELEKVHGMRTVPADKWSKGETNMSNRRAGILKINGMFENGTLFLSDKCAKLVQELEIHAYKGNGSEEVIKTNDDAIDALRYFVFSYKKPELSVEYKKQLKKIKRGLTQKRKY